MEEKTKKSIFIDDVEYTDEQLSDEQKLLINHIMDVNRKISVAEFNVQQLSVCKDAFTKMLKQSLSDKDTV